MSGSSAPAATAAPTAKYAVDGFIDPTRASTDTQINSLDLHGEIERQPGLVYYYTSLAAKAERQLSTFKLALEAKEADAAMKVRSEASAAGEKLTADMVKERVRKNSDVLALDKAVIKAREALDVAKGICEALRHKKDMLVMSGHLTRDEMKARLDVHESVAADSAQYIRDKEVRTQARLAERRAASAEG